MAQSIFVCLNMGETEKRYRIRRMREKLHVNSLSKWWRKLRRSSELSTDTADVAYG
jgi:trehalose-6-phosphate synthase